MQRRANSSNAVEAKLMRSPDATDTAFAVRSVLVQCSAVAYGGQGEIGRRRLALAKLL